MAAHPQRRAQFVLWMIVLGIGYALASLTLFFFPLDLVQFIAIAGRVVRLDLSIQDSNDPFFIMMAVQCTAVLSCLCLLAAESPKTTGYAMTHIFAKVVAATGFGYAYLQQGQKPVHLVLTLAEIVIGVLSLTVLLRAGDAKTESPSETHA